MSHQVRECSTDQRLTAQPSRRIVVPCSPTVYDQIIGDSPLFRAYLEQTVERYFGGDGW